MRNKIVFITGSSNGIGAETALLFAAEGAKLVITYHKDRKAAEMTAQRCKEAGATQVIVAELDMADDASIDAAVKKTVSMFGEVHVLVNNAGVAVYKKLQDQTYAEIHAQLAVNLEGLIKITRAFLGFVKETIINVGSGAGHTGYAEMTTYCASKFAVRGFSKALAEELADRKVYCVNPGLTATRMTGFRGTPPQDIAGIILKAAKGEFNLPSGSDLDAWELLKN
jgi:NAD(P)-dependent dehydrogenase (short-subunit alcohol dehydrogenase family)